MVAKALSYSDAGGHHTVVLDKARMSIGRSPDQDIVLHDPLVSRQHAVILWDNDAYTVIDQNSTHGTYLNTVRVQRADLNPGDVLHLGSLGGARLQFHAQPAIEGASRAVHTSAGELLTSLRKLEHPASGPLPVAREIEQLNWLLRAARQLNESGALEDILNALLQLTLQLTGLERGFVFLRESGQMRFVHGLRADDKALEEDSTISRTAIQKAIESKSKFSVSDTLADDRASGWSSVMINKIRSIYCIPLRQRVSAQEPIQLLGLLYLDNQIRPGVLTEVDHQLLETIATEAAALLHNVLLAEAEFKARQAREELAVAAKIHSGLMSVALPELSYAVLQARSVPCLEIGGDFYDVIALENCVCMTIVDVSGKGVSAAIVAATLQGIIHAQLLARQDLPAIASQVNQFLCTRNVGKYATMVVVRLFPDGRIEYMNCGHVHPLVMRGIEARRLEESNLIVGLIAEASYASVFDTLQPGERLLLATDGITEAENSAGDLFGYEGLSDAAREEDVGAILDSVAKFHAPNQAQDDCTLLEVIFRGGA
jgi:serine phosphatase RsbU (regulator of sigma subunit)